jgi:16S rRNA (guanine966-N2)-methyltransferase
MRVVAGRFRGRRLRSAPAAVLRPTADRVREALFNILVSKLGPADHLQAAGALAGMHVVDLYAGTGALGIEALSRGAERVTWVERDPKLVSLIRENLVELGVREPSDPARVLRSSVDAFLSRLAPDPRLVLLADPPYDRGAPGVLRWLATHPGGYAAAVLEHAAADTPGGELSSSASLDRRKYGNVGLTLFTPLA